jgi:hypothetical protein
MIHRMLACFALGGLLGGIVVFLWLGKDLDRLYLEVSHLTMQNNELLQENFQLSGQLKEPRARPRVRNVLVDVRGAPDALVEIRAIKFVKQRLSHLLGDDLDALMNDPGQILVLLEGPTTMSVDKKEYQFRVLTTIVSETIYVRVQLIPYTQTGAKAHAVQ